MAFGGYRDDGDRSSRPPRGDRESREFFKATCSDCGKECEVPFKPTEGRPVYCRDCFKKHQPADGGRRGGRDRSRF